MSKHDTIRLHWPMGPENHDLFRKDWSGLRAGQEVLISGSIYSARDQAHKRLIELLDSGKSLPLEIAGACIYYMGPAPTPPGEVIGSCGPTTASRMDPFTPRLLDQGLTGIIGKGNRSEEVRRAIIRNRAVYFYAYGGCGALYAEAIVSVKTVAFEDLGPEAILELQVKNFPAIVAIDSRGDSVFSRT